MLSTIEYLETELDAVQMDFLKHAIENAGGKSLGIFTGDPILAIRKIFEYSPDILITGAQGPFSITWAFLLRLRGFHLQGKKYPVVILTDPVPTAGRYSPELDSYSEDHLDYYYDGLPYNSLYDISLTHPEEFETCFATLEVKHLAEMNGVRKQWLLTSGQVNYARLTFRHLKYVPYRCPIMLCDVHTYPPFQELRARLDKESDPNVLGVRLDPINESMTIDQFVLANRFFIETIEKDIGIRLTSLP